MPRFRRPTRTTPVPIPEAVVALVTQKSDGSRSLHEVECEVVEHRLVCSIEVATHSVTNAEARHDNEDRIMTVDHTFGDISFHTIGVCDGHDSENASDFVSRNLPMYVEKHSKAGLMIDEAYLLAMHDAEEALKKVCDTAGTCVCSCTVAGPYVWCANLGDCRCGLILLEVPESSCSPTKVIGVRWMSKDHKASAPEERRRVMNLGGTFTNGRIAGLEPTRTLGDFDVKEQTKPGVISIEPDVRCHRLGDGTSPMQAILICATDGVWDEMTGQDICDLVHARREIAEAQVLLARGDAGSGATPNAAQPLRDLAEDVVQFAVAKGSCDDCTAVVALLSVAPA